MIRSVSRSRKPKKRTGFYEEDRSVLHDDNIQEFHTRCDEVLLSESKIPSDDDLESQYKLRIRESAHLKTVLELYDMEIREKISMLNYQKMKTKGREIKDNYYETLTPGTGKLEQEQRSRIERD